MTFFSRYQFEDGVNYDKISNVFVAIMVNALNLCGSIGEHQVYQLLHVILAGLKGSEDHPEFRSAAIILFAALVPRVSVKSKVTKKLLKMIERQELLDVETLTMLALLYRCQKATVAKDKVLKLLLAHEDIVLNRVFHNVEKQAEEDEDFARRVLKMMALLTDDVVDVIPTAEVVQLLGLVHKCLLQCAPTAESAEILIASLSKALVQFKADKKAAKKNDASGDELKELRKKAISECKRILDILKNKFVEEYAAKSVIKSEVDLLFVDGVEMPSAEQIAIKRLLVDNEFIAKLASTSPEILTSERDLETKLKDNANAVKVVLGGNPDFLLSQMPPENLVFFMANVLTLYARKHKVITPALEAWTTLSTNTDVIKSADNVSINFDLVLLSVLLNGGDSLEESARDLIVKLGNEKSSLILKDLVPVLMKKKKDEKLIPKLLDNVLKTEETAVKFEDILRNSKVHGGDAALNTCYLLAAAKSKFKPKLEMILPIMFRSAKDKCITDVVPKKDDDGKEMEVGESKLVSYAFKTKSAHSETLAVAIKSLDFDNFEDVEKMFILASLLRGRKYHRLSQLIFTALKAKDDITDMAAILVSKNRYNFPVIKHSEAGWLAKLVRIDAIQILEEKSDLAKTIMSFKSNVIPHLISGLADASKKVRKAVLSCLEEFLTKPVARTQYASLIKHIVNSKANLMATSANYVDVIKAFIEENRSTTTVLHALQEAAMASEADLFPKMAAILSLAGKDNKKSIVELAMFGTGLFADAKMQPLQALLNHCIPAFLEHIGEKPVWEFFVNGTASDITNKIIVNGIAVTPACGLLEQVAKNLNDLQEVEAQEMLAVLIDLSRKKTIVDSSHLMSARNAIAALMPNISVKVIHDLLVTIWGKAFFTKATSKAKSGGQQKSTYGEEDGDDVSWLKTTFLFEVSQEKLDENGASVMIKPMSVLLKKALFEQDQCDLAYVLDLLVSSTLRTVEALNPDDLEKNVLDPELVVQCIRSIKNRETQATALLLLAKSTAAVNAEYVLHNSIPLFTFVGTHFLQVESKSSFTIACTAIDIIVPHILTLCRQKSGDKAVHDTTVAIMNTFVDASTHMPRHRFCVFMQRLIQKLDANEYLWLLTLLLISRNKKSTSVGEKQQQLADLYAQFGANTQLTSLVRMFDFMSSNSKENRALLGLENDKKARKDNTEAFEMVRVKMLSFSQNLLQSDSFQRLVFQSLEDDMEVDFDTDDRVISKLQALLEASIKNIDAMRRMDEDSDEEDQKTPKKLRIRKQMVGCTEKVFEAALAIVPPDGFVQILDNLLDPDQSPTVRRKALEVLNARLQAEDDDAAGLDLNGDGPGLPRLLIRLGDIATSSDNLFNQQIGLMCVRSLAKKFSSVDNDVVMDGAQKLAQKLTDKKFLEHLENMSVKAATMLCLSDLYIALGPRAVVHLNVFLTWVLDMMASKERLGLNETPIVLNTVVVSIQKAIDNFGGFLNPFYQKLVVAVCHLVAWHGGVSGRVKHLIGAVAKGIPSHSLVNLVSKAFDKIVLDSNNDNDGFEEEKAKSLMALAAIIKENVTATLKNPTQVASVSVPFSDFFLQVLKSVRQRYQDSFAPKTVDEIEASFVDSFLAIGLKLQLDDFKPLFYKLFNLALDTDNKTGVTTAFHVTELVAKTLRSYFGFACEMVIQKATGILGQYGKAEKVEASLADESVFHMILHVLTALTSIYASDRVETLLVKHYEDHVNAMVSYLDGIKPEAGAMDDDSDSDMSDDEDDDDEPADKSSNGKLLDRLKTCFGQLAAATQDETQWKYLNYQVLLHIRNSNVKVRFHGKKYSETDILTKIRFQVRMAVLDMIELFVVKKGVQYMSVLPDSVHLLAEALEDDDQKVEYRCRALIKKMEEVFGQSIESYFE